MEFRSIKHCKGYGFKTRKYCVHLRLGRSFKTFGDLFSIGQHKEVLIVDNHKYLSNTEMLT